jgi:acyl-CoA synthetase (AMP-forming)/AMP-acid ligase II
MSNSFRRVANEIYKNFPFFYLSRKEFITRCLPLQRCGAGIVLGHVKSNFKSLVIQATEDGVSTSTRVYENLPLGHFGEIVFKKEKSQDFTHTGLYGFFDQRGRVWCCGNITDTIHLNGKKFFPYCIEPLFERLWWVKKAHFCGGENETGQLSLQISVVPKSLLFPMVKLCEGYFIKKLQQFSQRFQITSHLDIFSIKPPPKMKK